jgi:ABC-type phosphate transport system substrate-binding protein
MTHMHARFASIAVALGLAVSAHAAPAAEDGFVVVVNAANPVDALPRSEVSALFLKRTTAWPNGQHVEPVDRADGAVRDRFCNDVHGRSAGTIKTYWARLVFSGRDTPPVAKATDEDVVAFVRSNPGAVGYVAPGAAGAGVKVLKVQQ